MPRSHSVLQAPQSVKPNPRICGASQDRFEHLLEVRNAIRRSDTSVKGKAPRRLIERYFGATTFSTIDTNGLGALRHLCSEEDPKCYVCPLRFKCEFAASTDRSHFYQNPAITFGDIFSGAGGLSLGFEQTGIVPKLAVEIDPWFCETYKYNRPGLPLDVVKNCDLVSWLRDKPDIPELDILAGGVPCQPFSNANRQPRDLDPRRDLYRTFFGVLASSKSRSVIIENVAGFKQHEDEIIKLFADYGYVADSRFIDAVNFGLPQRRRRLFFIAYSQDHFNNAKERLLHSLQYIDSRECQGKEVTSLQDAIGDLPSLEACRVPYQPEYESADSGFAMQWLGSRRRFSRYVRGIHKDGIPSVIFNHKARFNNDRDIEIFSLLGQGENSRAPQIEGLMPYASRNHIFADKYHKLFSSEPCRTITAHMRYDCNTYIHPEQSRGLTAREAARVQGFPDDYVFLGTFQRIYQQIGNAVPPPLARLLASAIKVGLKGV
jgi:DNA (cytosine-5)-methyltransferase 1